MAAAAVSSLARVHDGVSLGPDTTVGDFSIVGLPNGAGPKATAIGAGSVIRSHTTIYAGNVVGDRLQTGHGSLIREDNRIGAAVSIGSLSIVEHHVEIGDGVRIHGGVFVPEYTVLEARCWLGPRVCLTNARYPTSPHAKSELEGVRVCAGARIGANVTIVPGVAVGAGALVGAGSVVTKDVEAGTVVVGNPARVVGRVADLSFRPKDRDTFLAYPKG